jgi:hypothetical protein
MFRPPPWPFWLFLGGGIILLVLIYFRWDSLLRLSATHNEGNMSVWVYNPDVAPGDKLLLCVGVYGGLHAEIDSVEVRHGERALRLPGSHRTKSTIRLHDRGADQLQLEWDVPADASPGETMTLRVQVTYTLAKPSGKGFTYTTKREQEAVEVPVTVLAHEEASRWHFWQAGRALGLFALVLAFGFWAVHRSWNWGPYLRAFGGGTKMAVIAWLLFSGFVGYSLFTLPLVAATSVSTEAFQIVLTVCWVFVPCLLIGGWFQVRRYWKARNRRFFTCQLASLDSSTALLPRGIDLEVIGRHLSACPAVLVRFLEGHTISVKHARGSQMCLRVSDPGRITTLESIRMEGGDPFLAITCCLALLPLLGPHRLVVRETAIVRRGGALVEEPAYEATLVIDGKRSIKELLRELPA